MGVVIRRKPMTGVGDIMGEVGRAREHLQIVSFCDVIMYAEIEE